MAYSDRVPVRAFYLIGIEPFREPRYWASAQVTLHVPDADFVEIEDDGTLPGMLLLPV